jgi:hypothetical protein
MITIASNHRDIPRAVKRLKRMGNNARLLRVVMDIVSDTGQELERPDHEVVEVRQEPQGQVSFYQPDFNR